MILMPTFSIFPLIKVFLLDHVRKIELGEEDIKLIGVYSSEELAKQAIARLFTLPGFIAVQS